MSSFQVLIPKIVKPVMTPYLTPQEVAAHLGIKIYSVITWIERAELKAVDLREHKWQRRNKYRVSPASLKEFEDSHEVVENPPLPHRGRTYRRKRDPNAPTFEELMERYRREEQERRDEQDRRKLREAKKRTRKK